MRLQEEKSELSNCTDAVDKSSVLHLVYLVFPDCSVKVVIFCFIFKHRSFGCNLRSQGKRFISRQDITSLFFVSTVLL